MRSQDPAAAKSLSVYRTGADGKLDASFGVNGAVSWSAGNTVTFATVGRIVLLSDGTAFASGIASLPNNGVESSILRFDGTGHAIDSFGTKGRAVVSSQGYGIDLLPDGDGVVALLQHDNTTWSVRRYTSIGVLDATFGNAGTIELPQGQFRRLLREPITNRLLVIGSPRAGGIHVVRAWL